MKNLVTNTIHSISTPLHSVTGIEPAQHPVEEAIPASVYCAPLSVAKADKPDPTSENDQGSALDMVKQNAMNSEWTSHCGRAQDYKPVGKAPSRYLHLKCPLCFPLKMPDVYTRYALFQTNDGLYHSMRPTAGNSLVPIPTFAWMGTLIKSDVGMRVLGIKRFQNARLTF